ncbi:unnamed protein product [Blepharisma stoltei]|uniref:Uncharacterized protein n=1 Tax=Blepharisma stoltei TaxID=1481888 RepID=A0AAU9JEF3_9CILI|nr:unnamed protein product [Blepharisma stoltei]
MSNLLYFTILSYKNSLYFTYKWFFKNSSMERKNSYEIQPLNIEKLQKRQNSIRSISDQKNLKNNPFSRQNLTIKETAFKTDTQHIDNTYEDIINGKDIENDKNSVQSDTRSQSLIQNDIVKLSSCTIKIFHIALVLSVKFI